MLAMIAHDSTKQREYALDAHFFIMKMWEQSYQCLNATLFFEQHKQYFAIVYKLKRELFQVLQPAKPAIHYYFRKNCLWEHLLLQGSDLLEVANL